MKFRDWVKHIWLEHCEEIEAWTGRGPGYLSQEYFNMYKWWLRREYRARHTAV